MEDARLRPGSVAGGWTVSNCACHDNSLRLPRRITHALCMRSMTGFGRGQHSDPLGRVVVEIRAINRRQADVHIRLPHELEALEDRVRQLAVREISRGRLEVSVAFEPSELSV